MSKRAVFLAMSVLAVGAASRSQGPGPEKVIRSLVRAMYAADAKSFAALTLHDPGIGVLTRGGAVNRDGLRELDEDPAGVQIITKRPPEYRGVAARLDASGKYPLGTTALYVVAHHRSPLVMIVQMTTGGWKVDPRWWIGMVGLSMTEPKQGRLPTGQIAEGSARPDVKLLVGLLGPVEIPFVVRQIGGSWRVDPQPYFMLIES